LEGRLCVHVGHDEVEARAGSAVFVRRGTQHTYWNPGPGPARFPLVMSSNIYRLIQEIHAMQERTPSALHAEFEKHDSQLLD
jgi:mannose-6-phosphate isomerase-like protein (cupin superfamily)